MTCLHAPCSDWHHAALNSNGLLNDTCAVVKHAVPFSGGYFARCAPLHHPDSISLTASLLSGRPVSIQGLCCQRGSFNEATTGSCSVPAKAAGGSLWS